MISPSQSKYRGATIKTATPESFCYGQISRGVTPGSFRPIFLRPNEERQRRARGREKSQPRCIDFRFVRYFAGCINGENYITALSSKSHYQIHELIAKGAGIVVFRHEKPWGMEPGGAR